MREELYHLLRAATGCSASDCWRWSLAIGDAITGLDHHPDHCGPFVVGPTSGCWLLANQLEYLFELGHLTVAW